MPAPFKRTRTKEINKIAEEVITAVKKELKNKKEDINEVKVDVCLYGHGARPFGSYLPNDYRDVTIKVGTNHWDGLDNHDVSALKNELNKFVSEFDEVVTDGIFFSYGNFTADVEKFPTTFRMFGKPCKEFKTLSKLVEKKYGINLKLTDIYNVRLFGKSGRYDESGERVYVAFNDTMCNELINEIKSFGRKKTKTTITNIDDIDTDYSRKYLTECYGIRKRSISITLGA